MGVASGVPYPISRSTGVCASTGRAFEPGERFVAVMVETPGADDLRRMDFSIDAWRSGARPPAPSSAFAFWHATAGAHITTPRALLDDAELVDLFEQLAGATEPKRAAFRYVLALLLVRRRLLRVDRQQRGTLIVRTRDASPDSPPYEVPDPGLDDGAIAGVMEQFAEILPDAPAPAGNA